MAVTVTPTGTRNTHHLKLSLSGTDVGLILCKPDGTSDEHAFTLNPTGQAVQIYSGETKYEDTAPPWSLKAQDDWSGGRGSKDLDRNASKYYDGWRINTTRAGEVILAGWDSYATGIRNGNQYWPGCIAIGNARSGATMESAGVNYRGIKFTPTASYTTAFIWLWLKYTGTPSALNISIYSDSSGSPNASLATTTQARTSLIDESWNLVRIALSQAVVSATDYWLVLNHSGSSSSYWATLRNDVTSTNIKTSTNGSTWSANTSYSYYYRITDAEDPFTAHFCEYKGSLFAALEYEDGGSSRLFLNGEQGAATSGSTTTLLDTAKTWTDDQWNGGIVVLNENTGSAQPHNWSLINDTVGGGTDRIDLADTLKVAPAAQTLYSIIGVPSFQEITTTGTPPDWDTPDVVTGALSVNHGILFPCGDSSNTWRLRFYNSSGTWTTEWIEETNCKFTYLEWANDNVRQGIWGAKGGYPSTIAVATARDWSGTAASSTVLTFGSAINTGDVGKRIRSLIRYGEYRNLHILKTDNVMQVLDDKVFSVGAQGLGMADDGRNGVASLVHGTYLYFSYHNTLLRYHGPSGNLDNIGPTRDEEGFPANRLGPIVALVGYENLVIAAFDGGETNFSCIMAYNGQGCCEWYRPPAVGLRIRSLHIQTLPGDNVDRLWFSVGSDIAWMPIASDPINFPQNNNFHYYAFSQEGNMVSSWYYFNQNDSNKVFAAYRVLAENIVTGGTGKVYMDYEIDEETSWTQITSTVFDSFRDSITLSSAYDEVGRRMRIRNRLMEYRPEQSPRITGTVLRAMIQNEVNDYVDIIYRTQDREMNLLGQRDDYATSAAKEAQLNTWSLSPQPVLVRAQSGELDNIYYKLDHDAARLVAIVKPQKGESQETYVRQRRLYKVS